jgi:hypothetical protein
MSVTPTNYDPSAWVSTCCRAQVCALCGQPASTKVAEAIATDDPFSFRQALTAYVCASHFQQIMGVAGVRFVLDFRAKFCGTDLCADMADQA